MIIMNTTTSIRSLSLAHTNLCHHVYGNYSRPCGKSSSCWIWAMEVVDGLLPGVGLFHGFGWLSNGGNHLVSQLWVHKIPWCTLLSSSYLTHATLGGQINKATSHWQNRTLPTLFSSHNKTKPNQPLCEGWTYNDY
jgi:hypothetical protein